MSTVIPDVASIEDATFAAHVQGLLDVKTKPVGSLGMLEQLAQTPESMVVLGAEPTRYDPSLGYIHTKGEGGAVEVIESFHEKPDPETVDELAEAGRLYWNTACYGVRVGRACDAYRTALPLIFDSIERFARGRTADPAYRGAAIGGHEIYPLLWAGMECLVVPRRHIATLNDVAPGDDALVGSMARCAAAIARQRGVDQGGYRTVFNCNSDAGQTVFHIHLHVLGGRRFGWPPG